MNQKIAVISLGYVGLPLAHVFSEKYDITTNVLLGMKTVLTDFKPDVVFVHGNTSTAFTASPTW